MNSSLICLQTTGFEIPRASLSSTMFGATSDHWQDDSPHFADDFSVTAYLLSGRYEAEDSAGFLDGETVVPPLAYESEKYEPLEPCGRASDLFACWLVERWNHQEYSQPAYAGHHDSNYCTRLLDGKELEWDEVKFKG